MAVAGVEYDETLIFDPQGLLGLCYWYAIYPLHETAFGGMVRGIARAAQDAAADQNVEVAITTHVSVIEQSPD